METVLTINEIIILVGTPMASLVAAIGYLYRQNNSLQERLISITQLQIEEQARQREALLHLTRQIERTTNLLDKATSFNEIYMDFLRKNLE